MNSSIVSESDSSQYQKTQGQPPLSAIQQQLCSELDQESAKTLIDKFIPAFKSADGQEFNECLKLLQIFFQKGYANQFTQDTGFLRKLMKQFSRFSYELQKDPKAEGKMIYILSIIAMLIKQVPAFKFPFRIKFIKNFFLIDGELLEVSPYKNNILAILAVIYENLSTQMRLVKSFKMVNQFKTTVLSNFSVIEQLFSIQLFNKTIYNMVKSGEKFTESEIRKYGLVETVSRFISKTQMSLFMNKLQTALVKTRRNENIIITKKPEMVNQY